MQATSMVQRGIRCARWHSSLRSEFAGRAAIEHFKQVRAPAGAASLTAGSRRTIQYFAPSFSVSFNKTRLQLAAPTCWHGRFSDKVGRHRLNVGGMWLCGIGVALLPLGQGSGWWSMSAAIAGLGMALLYPNLSAAVADISHPNWRASAIGICRFWRDLGYAVGALGFGAAAAFGGRVEKRVLDCRHRHGIIRACAVLLGRGNQSAAESGRLRLPESLGQFQHRVGYCRTGNALRA